MPQLYPLGHPQGISHFPLPNTLPVVSEARPALEDHMDNISKHPNRNLECVLMAYAALIIAILALGLAIACFYILTRSYLSLQKSVMNALLPDDVDILAIPEAVEPHETPIPAPAEQLEAITMTDEYEYNLEQKLIDEGKAVEYS